jgi:transcription antitermination factor NusG
MFDAITPADWFAVQTRYRFEKKVASQLEQKGCQVYLPLLCERHAWSDRQKAVAVPLFPGYAFVYIDQSRDSRKRVLQTLGLIGFVHFGGAVVPVPKKQIDDLQSLQRENARFALYPFIKAGQRVRVRGGCLNGLEGMLLEQNERRLIISIEAIQRSIAIEASGYELELA